MIQTMDCNEARISLGVYVLGAIDPAERALVDAHLATCQECRDELAELAGLPALLARVGKEEALRLGDGDDASPSAEPAPEPPPELLGTVLDLAAARRRRRTWRNSLAAAAAAVIVLAGSFTGAHYLTSSGSPPPSATGQDTHPYGTAGLWESSTGSNGAGEFATVDYRAMGWGVQLDTKVVGIGVGVVCQLYVIPTKGKPVLAGSWMTDQAENTIWYSGGAYLGDNQIKQFEITTGPNHAPIYITPS